MNTQLSVLKTKVPVVPHWNGKLSLTPLPSSPRDWRKAAALEVEDLSPPLHSVPVPSASTARSTF